MDVLSIPVSNEYYRMFINKNKKLQLLKTNKDESSIKVCKIIGKTTLKKGLVQLNLFDVRCILVKKDNYKVGESLLLELPSQKIKEHFKINDIPQFMEKIRKKELYQYDLHKDYIFRNLITDDIVIGRLIDVKFIDDITDFEEFIITNLKTNQINFLKSSKYSRIQFNMNEIYFFHKNIPLTLIDIKLTNNHKEAYYLFSDRNGNKIRKPILKTRLPNSVSSIKDLKGNEIFLKNKGELNIFSCTNVKPSDKLNDFQIEISNIQDHEGIKTYPLSELIIRPKKIYLSISRSDSFRKSEIKLMNWLSKRQLQVFLHLKKPVNNLEIGYIQEIIAEIQNLAINSSKGKNKDKSKILFKNIFGKELKIPYKELEMINFKYNSVAIQLKSETSLTSRLGLKILKKFKPEQIIIP